MMENLFSLQGKTVLIVGASSGIGKHAAKIYASYGAKLILAARRKDLLDELAAELNGEAHYVDVTIPESIADLFSRVANIDVMLNTSGFIIRKPALEHTDSDWDSLMAVNLKGSWSLNQAMIKHMIKYTTRGSIINISSIFGKVTHSNYALYATSKAGIEHMTRSFALEAAQYNIRVNAIAPGYIETDLNREFLKNVMHDYVVQRTPLGRIGQLDDLNGILLLLAGQASLFITGSVLPVDGGCSAHLF